MIGRLEDHAATSALSNPSVSPRLGISWTGVCTRFDIKRACRVFRIGTRKTLLTGLVVRGARRSHHTIAG
jgi:hypothetical protein